jgi:hypothetical protein
MHNNFCIDNSQGLTIEPISSNVERYHYDAGYASTTSRLSDMTPGQSPGDGEEVHGPVNLPKPTSESGIGTEYVGSRGLVILGTIILLATVAAIYMLIALWPTNAASAGTPSRIAGFAVLLDREHRLFVVVAIAGALGGLVHCARSLYEYSGNRQLRKSWILMYVSLPFIGSALSVIFYVILRGGLITGTAAEVNFFGFASVSALVGMFSPEAAEKLKQIFSTLLAPVAKGRDRLERDDPVH